MREMPVVGLEEAWLRRRERGRTVRCRIGFYATVATVTGSLLWGCRDAPPVSSDTASAREDIFDAQEEPLQLAAEPLFTVGLDQDLPLDNVSGAVLLHDKLAVADGNQVLLFDLEGRLLGRRGRAGLGPGEYKTLRGLVAYGDSLVALDIALGRLSVLDSGGDFHRFIQIVPKGFPILIGTFDHAVLLEYRTLNLPGSGIAPPHESRLDIHYDIYDLHTGTLIWETSRPGVEQWSARTQDRMSGGIPIIFGRGAAAATAGGRAYLGTTDRLQFSMWDATGDSTAATLPHLPVIAERSWAGMVKDSMRADIERLGSGRFMQSLARFRRDLLRSLPARDTLPSFADLKGGSGGRLWIQEYPSPLDDHVRWVEMDDELRPVQWIRMPRDVTVLDFRRGKVVVLRKGALGEESLEVYDLV